MPPDQEAGSIAFTYFFRRQTAVPFWIDQGANGRKTEMINGEESTGRCGRDETAAAVHKNRTPRPTLPILYPSETAKGSRAIVRALLMATVNSRWCLAQFPVMRRGMILPLSVVKSLSVCGSLYSIFRFESVQKRQNFLR
jgi:hypothetical protein